MDAWLITIITVACTTIVGYFAGKFCEWLYKNTTKYKDAMKNQKKEELREVIREEVAPINENIEEIKEKQKEMKKDIGSVKEGTQASLRDDLYRVFAECNKKGYATIDERENFENLYDKYHHLGANGVMDNLREKFLNLPLEKPIKKKQRLTE